MGDQLNPATVGQNGQSTISIFNTWVLAVIVILSLLSYFLSYRTQNVDEKIESSGQVSWRKDAFIDMLHHIKVCFLQRFSPSLHHPMCEYAPNGKLYVAFERYKEVISSLKPTEAIWVMQESDLSDARMVADLCVYA